MHWRQMADGIGGPAADPQDIRDAFGDILVACYLTGEWAWTQAQRDLFSETVTIVTYLAGEGDVADCENGDLTPAQAGDWISMRKAAGYYRPTVYCSASAISAVRTAAGKWVLGIDYDIWAADWTNVAHEVIAPGPGPEVACAVTQYASNQDWDRDAVYFPCWPFRTAPRPTPPTSGDDDMLPFGTIDETITSPVKQCASWAAGDGGSTVTVLSGGALNAELWIHHEAAAVGWYEVPVPLTLPAEGGQTGYTIPGKNYSDVNGIAFVVLPGTAPGAAWHMT